METCKKILRYYDIYPHGFVVIILFVLGEIFSFNDFLLEITSCSREPLYITIAQIMGTMSGIIMAGLAIFLTMEQSSAMKLLKKSPYYKDLFMIYIICIKKLLLGTVICLVALVLNNIQGIECIVFYFILWVLLVVGSGMRRCIWVLGNIVNLQTK